MLEKLADTWFEYTSGIYRRINSPDFKSIDAGELSDFFSEYPEEEFQLIIPEESNRTTYGSEIAELLEDQVSGDFDIWISDFNGGVRLEAVGSDPYTEINNLDNDRVFQNQLDYQDIVSYFRDTR